MVSKKAPSVEDLEAALRKLPVREDLPVPLKLYAEDLSFSLAIYEAPSHARALQPATKRQAVAELRGLDKALVQLDRALGELSLPATKAIDRHRRDLSLKWTVSVPQAIKLWLAEHYPGLAEVAIRAAAELESERPQAERGRRKDENIKTLMQRLADTYFAVTGKAPARHIDTYKDGREIGAFVRFVTEIFEVADIDRSAEHQARWAIADFKKRQEQKRR